MADPVMPPADDLVDVQTSWGVMLADAKDYLGTAPRLALYAGLAIFLCSLSFNLLGDGLRDVLDPRTTR